MTYTDFINAILIVFNFFKDNFITILNALTNNFLFQTILYFSLFFFIISSVIYFYNTVLSYDENDKKDKTDT